MDTIIIEKRKNLAQILQSARVQKGISQAKLAEMVGINDKTVMRIENCLYSPNLDILYKLANALEIDLKLNGITV
jgi:putative transcriptional regulator